MSDILTTVSELLHELSTVDDWRVDRENPEVIRIIPRTWYVDTGDDVFEVESFEETRPEHYEDVHAVEGGLTPVHVRHRVWQEAIVIDKRGHISRETFGYRTDAFIVNPAEPECMDFMGGHEWRELDVQLHGGGVFYEDLCQKCGLRRAVNTNTRHEITGERGYRSVTYRRKDNLQEES